MDPSSNDIVTQLLTGVAAVILLYIAMAMAEYLYKSFINMWRDRVELFPDTYVSGAKMFTAVQNPNNPKSKLASLSDNQRSGVEFSYSMFINLDSATFSSGEAKLHHIMHKGYSQFYPLMGPGVFCWGNKNCLRIYMNSYKTWNEYTEIDNIPVDNWFHLTISCKGTTIYIYINGNLKQKMKMSDGTPPYQNYGDVYLFSGRKKTIEKTNVLSYYIVTLILLNDYPCFLEWCNKNNTSLLQFKKTISSQISFCNFIEDNYKNNLFIKNVKCMEKLLSHTQKKDNKEISYLLKNLRMSICEMESF
jgi:hypothetical protein